MKVLGISAYYHDSAAAIIDGSNIIAAAQEERFTRIKHDSSFPSNAVAFCLQTAGVNIDELDAVAFYDKPLLKFERILESHYAFAPKGIAPFLKGMPVWIKDKLFLKKQLKKELQKVCGYDQDKLVLLFPEHHLSHAASAFFPSSFSQAAILTIDGVGEWATASICKGAENTIEVLKELRYPHSVGLLYSSFTYFLGFKVNSGEYKLMGAAPYGNRGSQQVEKFIDIIRRNLVRIAEDGSIWLNPKYFKFTTGLKMVSDRKWEQLFNLPKRTPESELKQVHCDLALAIQTVTEEIVLKMANEAKRLTDSRHLCLAGGVALNCVANGKIREEGIFEDIFIQPAAGDAGGALGAALAANFIYFNEPIDDSGSQDSMAGSYLGPKYSDLNITAIAKRFQASFKSFENHSDLCRVVAEHLQTGKVIGWFQGKAEYGPRALGNRSILADPTNVEMQQLLNLKIKYRESFRPFAPSVLAEDADNYFELDGKESPYMLFVHKIHPSLRKPTPQNQEQKSPKEKLSHAYSDLPAITHVDYSARIQTVNKDANPKYRELLRCFKDLTGHGVLINTSFNVRGEPIVNTPEEAFRCFMNTEMDYLVIHGFLFSKSDQVFRKNLNSSRQKFQID